MYCDAIAKLGVRPNTDLLASKLNCKLKPFVANQPDPEAFATHAFTLSWESYLFYAFPPFSLVALVIQNIQEEEATGLILVPMWPTQQWWPTLMRTVIQNLPELSRRKGLVYQPSQPDLVHPKQVLLLCHVSRSNSKLRDYHSRLQRLSWTHSETVQKNNMNLISKDGGSTAIKEIRIPFQLP